MWNFQRSLWQRKWISWHSIIKKNCSIMLKSLWGQAPGGCLGCTYFAEGVSEHLVFAKLQARVVHFRVVRSIFCTNSDPGKVFKMCAGKLKIIVLTNIEDNLNHRWSIWWVNIMITEALLDFQVQLEWIQMIIQLDPKFLIWKVPNLKNGLNFRAVSYTHLTLPTIA